MAVPKGKRSKQKCKRRQLLVFYDKLDGIFKTRREYLYRSFYDPPYYPRDVSQSQTTPSSINRPFRFPGFWPGRFAFQMAATLLTRGLKK